MSGNVQKLAQNPRFWQVTATAKTQEPATGEQQTKHFKFKPTERLKLSELAPLINDFIHEGDDFLPDCISVMVCARVMTEKRWYIQRTLLKQYAAFFAAKPEHDTRICI